MEMPVAGRKGLSQSKFAHEDREPDQDDGRGGSRWRKASIRRGAEFGGSCSCLQQCDAV